MSLKKGGNIPMPQQNDQTIKADNGKAKLSLVPPEIIYAIARIREYGNNKYPEGGKDNWKQVEPERYRDAMFRHLLGYISDPDSLDEESGYPHLWHLACNVAFLCTLEKEAGRYDVLPGPVRVKESIPQSPTRSGSKSKTKSCN